MTVFSHPGPAHCLVCRGPVHRPFALCYCCDTLVGQLRMPLVPMVAMAGYQLGDRTHQRLRGYKDAPVAEVRDRCRDELVTMAIRWLHEHGPSLRVHLGPPWDAVATVPSSRRPAGSPVDAVVSRVPDLSGAVHLALTRGSGPIGHLRADRLGFDLAPGVDRRQLRSLRVLVVDDSVVTGARAQSAAASLRLAGAGVAGVLALGRTMPADGVHEPSRSGSYRPGRPSPLPAGVGPAGIRPPRSSRWPASSATARPPG
jgi:hypothetical protein